MTALGAAVFSSVSLPVMAHPVELPVHDLPALTPTTASRRIVSVDQVDGSAVRIDHAAFRCTKPLPDSRCPIGAPSSMVERWSNRQAARHGAGRDDIVCAHARSAI